MSYLTIAWSMCGAASFMLGLLHLLLWFKDQRSYVYLLSVLMAFSAGAGAMTELALMHAKSIDAYRVLIRWENLFVFTLLVPMVWLVRARLLAARRWLAILITVLWSVTILANWLSPYSLVYTEITALKQMPTFWGEQFTLAAGEPNSWVHLANVASVLIVIYVADAAVRVWRAGDRRRAVLVGGGVATFILLGGIQAPLVDAGLIATPYMVSFAFLAIVLALSYELVSDAVLASRFANEIRASEAGWRFLLTDVQLAVIGIDPAGRVNYVNPFLERLIGHPAQDLIGKPMAALVQASDQAEPAERLAAASRAGPRPHSRWDLVCASGALRSLDWSTVRLNDRDGSYAGLLSIGEDITKRLTAERSLESTRRELERLGRANVLGELVSVLAHEFNQPLAAILSNAQAARRLLATDKLGAEELREILDDIVHIACVVLDVRMPGQDGMALQAELAARGVDLPIVFLTGHGDIPMTVEAMKKGAVDFLTKPVDEALLLDAVRQALLRHRAARSERLQVHALQERLASLTPRELEVLRCVITGALNKQIADNLGIAEKTVKIHRARAMEKLAVTRVVDLVRVCQRIGLEPLTCL